MTQITQDSNLYAIDNSKLLSTVYAFRSSIIYSCVHCALGPHGRNSSENCYKAICIEVEKFDKNLKSLVTTENHDFTPILLLYLKAESNKIEVSCRERKCGKIEGIANQMLEKTERGCPIKKPNL
jgi:hypothetical protein